MHLIELTIAYCEVNIQIYKSYTVLRKISAVFSASNAGTGF